jgi:hypothetical protein
MHHPRVAPSGRSTPPGSTKPATRMSMPGQASFRLAGSPSGLKKWLWLPPDGVLTLTTESGRHPLPPTAAGSLPPYGEGSPPRCRPRAAQTGPGIGQAPIRDICPETRR